MPWIQGKIDSETCMNINILELFSGQKMWMPTSIANPFSWTNPLSTPDLPETHWATKISSLSALRRELKQTERRERQSRPVTGARVWKELSSLLSSRGGSFLIANKNRVTTVTKTALLLRSSRSKVTGRAAAPNSRKSRNGGTRIAQRSPSPTLIPTVTNQNQCGAGNYEL